MNENLQITKLGIKDLGNVLALQEKVIESLSQNEKYFTLKRSKEEFIKALDSDNMYMYGIYVGKSLVAQAILNFPKDNEPRELPEFAQGYKNSDIAIYQAVVVDPNYRGQGLMMRMLQAREDMSIMCGKKIAICKIAKNNQTSWKNALKHGMQITQSGIDKSGHHKLYLQKRLDCYVQYNPTQRLIFNACISAMVKSGKIGIWNKEFNTVAFTSKPLRNVAQIAHKEYY